MIESSACRISAAVGTLPTDSFGWSGAPSYVAFQATNGHGTCAGISFSYTGPAFVARVVEYSRGGLRVLDTFAYSGWNDNEPSVRAVGIDNAGDVVVKAQKGWGSTDFTGYRYDAVGRRSILQDSPLWRSVDPVAVTPAGLIVGDVQRRGVAGRVQAVTWSGPGRATVHLIGPMSSGRVVGTDNAGDLVFSNGVARMIDGRSVQLAGYEPPRFGYTTLLGEGVAASRTSAYGISQAGNSVLAARWVLTGSAMTAVQPHRIAFLVWVTSVGHFDDVVGEYPGNSWTDRGTRVLVTRTGKAYRLPPQYTPPIEGAQPPPVIDDYGRVMYTGADRLPHLITCPM